MQELLTFAQLRGRVAATAMREKSQKDLILILRKLGNNDPRLEWLSVKSLAYKLAFAVLPPEGGYYVERN